MRDENSIYTLQILTVFLTATCLYMLVLVCIEICTRGSMQRLLEITVYPRLLYCLHSLDIVT